MCLLIYRFCDWNLVQNLSVQDRNCGFVPLRFFPGCESEDDAVKTVPGGSLRTLSVHEVKQQARLQLYVPFYLTLLFPLAL